MERDGRQNRMLKACSKLICADRPSRELACTDHARRGRSRATSCDVAKAAATPGPSTRIGRVQRARDSSCVLLVGSSPPGGHGRLVLQSWLGGCGCTGAPLGELAPSRGRIAPGKLDDSAAVGEFGGTAGRRLGECCCPPRMTTRLAPPISNVWGWPLPTDFSTTAAYSAASSAAKVLST